MTNKPFIISDLDGTLLDNPKKLSKQYITQLNDLIKKGMHFTIATGRDLEKTKKAVDGLILKYPVILTNGALLADLNTEEYLEITSIPSNIVEKILKYANTLDIKPIVFAAFDDKNNLMHFNKGKWWGKYYGKPISLNDDQVLPYKQYKVVSMQFHAETHTLEPLRQSIEKKFKDQIQIIYIYDVSYRHHGIEGEWWWLEINSKDAGKDKMAKKLAEKIGASIEDMIFFGDNLNDIDLLKAVGKGIAMENAPDEVKVIAKEICGKNTEGGVIEYLQQFYNLFSNSSS